MPLVQTRGAASAQGFGEFAQAAGPVNYIEDVFSTYLWDGNSTARNIVNGIDLATKGGMVWAKYRNATASNRLYDTNRGATKQLFSDLTNAEQVAAQSLTAFNTDGFSLGTGQPNETTATVVGWTFREQAKFFDIVTYTGDDSDTRQVAHNLGTSPAFIIIKCTSNAEAWIVAARNNNNNFENLRLNTTAASAGTFGAYPTGSAFVSSTTVGVGWWAMAGQATLNQVNASGRTYVAYLFAHDAGGFGTAGTDNVISCGSFTTDGSGFATVNLGYEPQYLMFKRSSGTGNWFVVDNMRNWNMTTDAVLYANLSNAEVNTEVGNPTATGFYVEGAASSTYIYMAIRRPMKVPTTGTSVFLPTTYTGNGATGQTITTDFPVDFSLFINRTKINSDNNVVFDRLRGGTKELATNTTDAEGTLGSTICPLYDSNTGVKLQGGTVINASGGSFIVENFRRASGFFDVVCYTGTGSATTQTHNLGVVPEMYIVKRRSGSTASWFVYHKDLNGGSSPQGYFINLNSSGGETNNTGTWNNTAPTSSVFSLGSASAINGSSQTYVAYLFASCPGVSKVGSYTGNGGSSQDIDCGFTAGARFVLIKRTDSTGDWWVWDTARGMVSGTDPRLALNSTAAESNANWVYTTTGGFQIVTSDATINASGGSYIFLSIA